MEQEEGGESSSCVSCWKEVDLEEMRRKPVKPAKPLKKIYLDEILTHFINEMMTKTL